MDTALTSTAPAHLQPTWRRGASGSHGGAPFPVPLLMCECVCFSLVRNRKEKAGMYLF